MITIHDVLSSNILHGLVLCALHLLFFYLLLLYILRLRLIVCFINKSLGELSPRDSLGLGPTLKIHREFTYVFTDRSSTRFLYRQDLNIISHSCVSDPFSNWTNFVGLFSLFFTTHSHFISPYTSSYQ